MCSTDYSTLQVRNCIKHIEGMRLQSQLSHCAQQACAWKYSHPICMQLEGRKQRPIQSVVLKTRSGFMRLRVRRRWCCWMRRTSAPSTLTCCWACSRCTLISPALCWNSLLTTQITLGHHVPAGRGIEHCNMRFVCCRHTRCALLPACASAAWSGGQALAFWPRA